MAMVGCAMTGPTKDGKEKPHSNKTTGTAVATACRATLQPQSTERRAKRRPAGAARPLRPRRRRLAQPRPPKTGPMQRFRRLCPRVTAKRPDLGEFDAAKLLCGARLQSRCAGALLGTRMEDTGGKSGRRPARHLQVEASGPGNAASVQQRLAGRFGGNLTRRNCCAGPGSKVGAPEASSGPGWGIQEESRVGAQRATSKPKLLARENVQI